MAAFAAVLLSATPAQAAAPTAQAAKSVSTVTVRSGDTLIKLAAKHCGAGSKYRALASGNGIANPNRIYVGQHLKLTCAKPATPRAAVNKTPAASSRIRTVVAYALAQRGDPYRFGAAGPNAFDCSGLVVAAYARVGIHLPHQTGALISRGVKVSRAGLRPGDLVFLSRSHVAIYIGGGKVVEAPHPGARVRVSTIYSYYSARRIIR